MQRPPSGIGLIWRAVSKRRLVLGGFVLLTVLAGLAETGMPWLMQIGVDTALGASTGWTLNQAGLAMIGVILAIVAGHMLTLWLETLLFAGVSFSLRERIYTLAQRMPLARLARHRSGALAYRATSDIASLEVQITDIASEAFFDAVVAAASIVAMLTIDLRLTGIVVLVMGIAGAISTHFTKALPVYKRAGQMLMARLSGQIQESISAARTVRVFHAEQREIARLDDTNRRLRGFDLRGGAVRALVTPLWHFAEALGILAVIWYGGRLVQTGSLSIGTLVGFLAYQQLLAGPINRAGGYIYSFQSCRGLMRRVVELAGQNIEAVLPPQPAHQGGIEVCEVSLSYPDSGRTILNGLNFSIRDGERVALLGRNGAGKSTVHDLLSGLIQPDSGSVKIGWRGAVMGVLPQETLLLRGTLADNLALATPLASLAEMANIIEQLGGAPLLSRLPRGLKTDVGERGLSFSGGERQLIGLARVLLRDPDILLLDEPTAHLDPAVSKIVIEMLARFTNNRTLLITTHSADLLALVQRGLLLDAGRIVSEGDPVAQLLQINAQADRLPTGDLVS